MIAIRAAIWMLCIVGAIFLGFAAIGLIADLFDVTVFALLFGVGLLILWAGALYDIWRRGDLGTASRLLWTLLIVLLPLIGTIIYAIVLSLQDVDLRFPADALSAISHEALKRGTGARALRSIIEEVMQGIMFEIPSRRDVVEVVVTEDAILRRSEPVVVTRNQLKNAS